MTTFVTSNSKPNYATALRLMLERSTPSGNLKIAVAFWGEHAIKMLSDAISKAGVDQCQFICNLESGATNPDLIQMLFDLNVAIKTNPTLHAKVILTPTECLTGSANLSANGLGVENNSAYWEEAGLLTKDFNVHAAAEKWFDTLFVHPLTYLITQADINQAKERRAATPPATTPWHTYFPMQALESWLDRKRIWLTLWHSRAHETSPNANAKVEITRTLTGLSGLDCYEEWPALHTEDRLIFDVEVDKQIRSGFWRRHTDSMDDQTLCFVQAATEIDCPFRLRDAWQQMMKTDIDIKKLNTFVLRTGPEERLISSSAQLRELMTQVSTAQSKGVTRLTNLLNFDRKVGGLIYIKEGKEGQPLNFKVSGSRGVSGKWRNHLMTKKLEWILLYHRLGANCGDVWVGQPNGKQGMASSYEIQLKNLEGPYRVQQDFESLTGKRPPQNPIYAN